MTSLTPPPGDATAMDVWQFMWRLQASGERTLPFFAWIPIEHRTGETIWRLWLLYGWTDQYASTRS